MKVHINLMYHDVYIHDKCESGFIRTIDFPYKLNVEKFESHVRCIRDLCKQKSLSPNDVIFTFDDGGKSFYTVIAPVLEKYGFKGLFFVSTQYIGTENFLTKEEIVQLYKSGHIIGSHAHSHEHFYSLSTSQIDMEWETSIRILSEIVDSEITYASVPNGDVTKQVIKSAYKYGIRYLYTSEPTVNICKYNDMYIYGRYVLLENSSSKYVQSLIEDKTVRLFLLFRRKIIKIIKFMLGYNYTRFKNLFCHTR